MTAPSAVSPTLPSLPFETAPLEAEAVERAASPAELEPEDPVERWARPRVPEADRVLPLERELAPPDPDLLLAEDPEPDVPFADLRAVPAERPEDPLEADEAITNHLHGLPKYPLHLGWQCSRAAAQTHVSRKWGYPPIRWFTRGPSRSHNSANIGGPSPARPYARSVAPLKQKGDLAELMIAADLRRRGYRIAFPYGEDCDYDLIVDRDGKLERVQVKHVTSNGPRRARSMPLAVTHQRRVRATKRYTAATVDWMAVWDATTNAAYYVPSAVFDGHVEVTLRLRPTLNGQSRKIRQAGRFLDI